MADWHPQDIKAAIRKRGGSVAALGRASGISAQALHFAISARTSVRCEQVIADFLGVAPQDIWPSRFDQDGGRILLRALSEREKAAA